MITYEEIKKANDTICTTPIKGKEYAEVPQRIKAFRMNHPNGTIQTEIISLVDGVVTMKASVFDEDGRLLGTGFAQEKESSSFINKTSFLENCETSAWGRALGACGYGIDVSIASAEEVKNAQLQQEASNQADEKKNVKAQTNTTAKANTAQKGGKAVARATPNQKKIIEEACGDKLQAWLAKNNLKSLDELTFENAKAIVDKINSTRGEANA